MSFMPAPGSPASISVEEIDARISFIPEEEILDIDLSSLKLENSADANLLYDRLEAKISETGETLWFFLINYKGTRIDPGAWLAHSRRGKALNLAHSMGTVRYDATEETRQQIERSSGTENFDPNLFADRNDAIARLSKMPSKRKVRIVHVPNYTADDFRQRILFRDDQGIMDVDFSGITFAHERDVNDCYDVIDELVAGTGRKWYFLINYENTKIFSEAWIQYSVRGKALNERASLGSVRYAPGSETETDIRLRAETGGFRPNIRNTREEALLRIAEMKSETATV